MSRIRVLYSRRHGIATPLLRLAAWSDWSHVALVDEARGEVVEAVAFQGVVVRPLDEAVRRSSRYAFGWLRCDDPAAALAAARSQVGKGYDYLGVLGIGLQRDWRDENRWFCSELVAWAVEQGGSPLFRRERMHRVTQEHLWMLASA